MVKPPQEPPFHSSCVCHVCLKYICRAQYKTMTAEILTENQMMILKFVWNYVCRLRKTEDVRVEMVNKHSNVT